MIRDIAGAKILVTGGAGLIGKPTVALLVERGAYVRIFDRAIDQAFVGATSIHGDLRDADAVHGAVLGMDAVVHLGGIPGPNLVGDVLTYEINTVGTYSILSAAAAAGVKKVVYASSINANGLPLGKQRPPTTIPYNEDEPAAIVDSYSLSKDANERAALMAATRWGLSITGLRFPLVRDISADAGKQFATHIRTALNEDPIRQAYEGWSYLHSDDAADAVLCALTHDTPAAPAILVAAPDTYLSEDTTDALRAVAPEIPVGALRGREVGLDLTRSRTLLDFRARLQLKDIDPSLLASATGSR